MKVVHVPFCFRPDPVGGTEIYVEALAREQQRRGVDVVVAAPGPVTSSQVDNGLPIRRFAVSDDHRLESLYGDGDREASVEFDCVIERERPDIVHLHSFTRAVSTRLAASVHKQGLGLVFTYHTPTVSCQRGTLLKWGREQCDGIVEVRACAGCTLHALGIDRRVSVLLGAVPTRIGHTLGNRGLSGGAWTAMRMTDLTLRRFEAFHGFMRAMDRIVVLCRWSADLLSRNGVPREKLTVSRQGLAHADTASRGVRQRTAGEPLRIAFLGRLHPTKGADTLIRAVRGLPDAQLKLDIYGVGDDTATASLRALAACDTRIRFIPPLLGHEVIPTLQTYDVLAVPSRWMETGPLVVLEAFAAGIPVVGSDLGGIAELVTHGIDGLLVEPESLSVWQDVLVRLQDDLELLPRLRAGIRPPRRMAAVADDMLRLYRELRPAA